VSAVSRHPDKLDVFVAGGDTYVHTAAWQQGVANSAWQGWWRILDARMPASVVGAIDRQLS
jgi:hypothetical protein